MLVDGWTVFAIGMECSSRWLDAVFDVGMERQSGFVDTFLSCLVLLLFYEA